MAVRVGYGIENQTHHLSLKDSGGHEVGLIVVDDTGNANPLGITRVATPRTAIKTAQGSLKYSDYEEPWCPQAQEVFTGRGFEDFEVDTTKFFDCRRINIVDGRVILSPLETYHTGIKTLQKHLVADEDSGGLSWQPMVGGDKKYLAVRIQAPATYTAKNLYLHLKRVGNPLEDLNISIYSDLENKPDTLLETHTITTDEITDYEAEFYRFDINQSLTSGSHYWIHLYTETKDEKNCWMVGVYPVSGQTYESSDGDSWSLSGVDILYMLSESKEIYNPKFFVYRRALYLAISPFSGAPKIYINGTRGLAKDNTGALNKLIDSGTPGWVTNEFEGAVVLIIAGKGYAEKQRWRRIISNDSSSLTVDEDWKIIHDTTTEYVIIGSNVWKEVTEHGITTPIYDIMIVNNICYFALGEDTAIRRMRYTSGAYTWASEADNKASFLHILYNPNEALEIWRGNNTDIPSVSMSAVKDWGTDLSFGTKKEFKDEYGKITGLDEYGETNTLWIMREGMVFYLSGTNRVPAPISLREIMSMMDDNNGISHNTQNVYLFFNLGGGLERYYGNNLDDVGVNRFAGLPNGRQGVYSALVAYPGKIFGAIDAGTNGYSSIHVSNGDEFWWELYRAPSKGERILAMAFQPLPGDNLDRLFAVVGENVISLNFPSLSTDPTKDSSYRYSHEGTLTSAYVYGNLFEIEKLYHAIRVLTEGIDGEKTRIDIDIRLDDEEEWRTLADSVLTSPSSEIKVGGGSVVGITGNRLQYRLRIQSTDSFISPKLKTVVIESIVGVPVSFSYTLKYRAVDNDTDLLGNPDDFEDAIDKVSQIEEWAMNLTPLLMRSNIVSMDKRTVFVNLSSQTPGARYLQRYINEISIVEV